MIPSQAVILCGGLGSRLRPLTDTMPKPMVPINRKPFLFFLLQQLAEQGVTRFLLLTGYMGQMISDYFKDGSQWNWEIEYSSGPTEWDTGRRLWEARAHFDEELLLLYSDNFVQFSLSKLQELRLRKNMPISLHIAPKAKGNIRLLDDGTVDAYDKSRSGAGFDFVEVGYMWIKRDEVLAHFAGQPGFPDFNFALILQGLANKSGIAGLSVWDPYHSISDMARLQLMAEYLAPKKIILIDRDGTINKKPPPGQYIQKWSEFEWMPETVEAMRQLAEEGFKFIVITNQAGVARGMVEPEDLVTIHNNVVDELALKGIQILEVYCCPDHWETQSYMRKPAPGMFFNASRDYKLRMDRCIYVGDDDRDCHAAYNAGCGMIQLTTNGESPAAPPRPPLYLQTKSLLDSVDTIADIYRKWGEMA